MAGFDDFINRMLWQARAGQTPTPTPQPTPQPYVAAALSALNPTLAAAPPMPAPQPIGYGSSPLDALAAMLTRQQATPAPVTPAPQAAPPAVQGPPDIVMTQMPAVAERWNALTPEQQDYAVYQSGVLAGQKDAQAANAAAAAIRDTGYDPLAGAITAVSDTVQKATTDPVGAAKDVIVAGGELANYPEHQVALGNAELSYQIAKGNKKADAAATIGGKIISSMPFGRLVDAGTTNAQDMARWAEDPDNKQAIIDAYEKGYVVKDENGNIVEQVEPGREAVLKLFDESLGDGIQGALKRISFGAMTDPLNLTGPLATGGEALANVGRATRTAEDAGLIAKVLGGSAEALGTVAKVPEAVSAIPGEAIIGGAKGVANVGREVATAVREAPIISNVLRPLDWWTSPTGRAAAEQIVRDVREATGLFEGSANLADEGAFAGTSLANDIPSPTEIIPNAPTEAVNAAETTTNAVTDVPSWSMDAKRDGQRLVDRVASEQPEVYARIRSQLEGRIRQFEAVMDDRALSPVDKTIEEGRFAADIAEAIQAAGGETPAWAMRFQAGYAAGDPRSYVEAIIHNPTEATVADRNFAYREGVLRKSAPRAELADEIRNASVKGRKVTVTEADGSRVSYSNKQLEAMTPAERERIAGLATSEQQAAHGRYQAIQDIRGRLATANAPAPTLGGKTGAVPSLGEAVDPLETVYRRGDIGKSQFDVLSQTVETKDGPQRLGDLYLAARRGGKTAKEATDEAIAAATPTLPRANLNLLGRSLRAVDRAYMGATGAVREHLMFNWLTGPRGILSDTLGDAWTQVTSGRVDAAARSLDPRTIIDAVTDVRKDGIDALMHTPTGATVDRLGLGTPVRLGVEEGREEVAREGATALQRLVERTTGSKGLGTLTRPLADPAIRDMRTALDSTRRWSLYGTTLERELPRTRDGFFDVLRGRAAAKGVDADTLIAGLGDEFSPADVRRLAAEAGFKTGDAEHLARMWRGEVNRLDTLAQREANRVAFDFASTKGDEVLKRLFLFHSWQTRAAPLYLANALRNPALAATYYRMADAMHQECEVRYKGTCGYLEFMKTGAGYAIYNNPAAMISTALISLEPDWQNPDDRMLDRVLGKMPAMVNPLFQGAISAVGLSGRAGDPLASYTFRRTLGGIIDYARANGWVGAQTQGEPVYEEFLSKLYDATSKVAEKYVPGARRLVQSDPQAADIELIQTRILDLVLEQYGLPADTDPNQLATINPEADQALSDALTAWQTHKTDNPIANQAFKDWSEANLLRRGAALLTQGGARLRSETRDERLLTKDTGVDAAGNRTAEGTAAANALTVARVGSPEAVALNRQGAAYDLAGTPRGRLDADVWSEIAYGADPRGWRIGGKLWTGGEIKALDEDSRKLLADQWIAETGRSAGLEQTRTERKAILAGSPEESAYREWRSRAYEYGVPAFRESAMKGNPNYRQYIEGLSPETKADPNRLNAASVSEEAYLALQGKRGTVFDPNPVETRDPTNVPFDPTQTGDTGNASSSSSSSLDPAARLMKSMQRYATDVAMFDQTLKTLTGNPNASWDGMNPMLQRAWSDRLGQMGISTPSMPAEVQDYLRWAGQQPRGTDTSVRAYVAAMGPALTAGSGTIDAATLMRLLQSAGLSANP